MSYSISYVVYITVHSIVYSIVHSIVKGAPHHPIQGGGCKDSLHSPIANLHDKFYLVKDILVRYIYSTI